MIISINIPWMVLSLLINDKLTDMIFSECMSVLSLLWLFAGAVRLPAARLARSCFFFHAWFVVIVFLYVLVCIFLFSSPRCLHRSWETRPHQHWAHSHHPPPVLHWLRDILISGMLHKKWLHDNQSGLKSLFEPTYLLSIDSLNQFLELQRPIWTHSAQWTGRGLSKDTHLFPTYRRFVLGQRAHHCMSPHEKQRSSFEKGLIIFV